MFAKLSLLSHFHPNTPPPGSLTHPFQGLLFHSLQISWFPRQSRLLLFLSLSNWKAQPWPDRFFSLPKPSLPVWNNLVCFQGDSLTLIPGNSLTCFITYAAVWLPNTSTMKQMPRFYVVQCIFIGHLLYDKLLETTVCGGVDNKWRFSQEFWQSANQHQSRSSSVIYKDRDWLS